MNKWRAAFLYYGCWIFLLSCSRTHPHKRVAKQISSSQLLSVKASLAYKNGHTELRGILNLRIQPDSLIWVSVDSGIGFELFRALATKEHIQVLSRLEKKHRIYTYELLSSYLGMTPHYDWLERILLAKPLLKVSDYKEILTTDSSQHLQSRALPLQVDTWISTKGNYVIKQHILDPRGYQMQVQYLYNSSKELLSNTAISTPYPKQLRLTLSRTENANSLSNWTLQLIYHKVKVLEKKDNGVPFKVPEGYERK